MTKQDRYVVGEFTSELRDPIAVQITTIPKANEFAWGAEILLALAFATVAGLLSAVFTFMLFAVVRP